MFIRFTVVVGTCVAIALLGGCSSKKDVAASAPAAATAPAASTGPKSDASIIDLMRDPIASNAEALWNAVGSESTTTGTKDIAPSTDAEWAALRKKATELMDVADMLGQDGRVVAHPGQKLKDPQGEKDLTPEQAQAAISKDHAAFAAFAAGLKSAAATVVTAIDKRNVEDYETAGGTLEEVCEACHTRYWHPESGVPK